MKRVIGFQCESDNFSSLFREANYAVYKHGIETQPRNLKIRELINVSLLLTNPRNRLLISKIRKHSDAYAAGEFLWYMRGAEDLEGLAFYSQSLRDYSDDGKTLNSAYGSRIFGTHKDFPNQWENVKNKLLADNDTRQAVININYPEDQNRVTKDVTCTLNLQYFIRERQLHAITVMRSNDCFMGLIYDTFCFTMMQELMLYELKLAGLDLDIDLGYYIHNVHSFHMYENHFDKFKKIYQEEVKKPKPMCSIDVTQLEELQCDELLLRTEQKEINTEKYSEPWKWFAISLNKKLKGINK